jgi:hypothetical protein
MFYSAAVSIRFARRVPGRRAPEQCGKNLTPEKLE